MKYLACWFVAGLAVAPALAEWPKKVVKPAPLCGVPGGYDYKAPVERSPLLTLASSPAVALQEVSTPPRGAPELKGFRHRYFQFPARGLAIDHCSITRINLMVREDGTYTVSFRADQHPKLPGGLGDPVLADEVSALRPLRTRETRHLQRNEFTVRFRFLGVPGREALPPAGVGRPVLVRLPLAPFWVERGEPKDVFQTDRLAAVAEYFALLEGVEVDFSYR